MSERDDLTASYPEGRTVAVMENPDDTLERELIRAGAGLVAGVDECGRGAAGGPASVGVVVVDLACLDRGAPTGVRDSKLLSPARRSALVEPINSWAVAHAVGHSLPDEIDRIGINRALRAAAGRAFATLAKVDAVILDGKYDWLAPGDPGLFDGEDTDAFADEVAPGAVTVMRVGADLTCVSVAAASVLAKVAHDDHMADLDRRFPGYGWLEHNGYLTAAHREAIHRQGLSEAHRRSWKIN